MFLKKIVEFLKEKMKTGNVEKISPREFILDMAQRTQLEMKPLRY